MPTWIAFLRGINVGGKSTLPMSKLVPLLKNLGCADIRTYVQSGNVVFQSTEGKPAALARRITSIVAREHGLEPHVFVMNEKDLAKAITNNPYRKAESDPKSLHLFFLESQPKAADVAALEKIRAKNERFTIEDKVLYLHAPDGIGKSKLAAAVERLLKSEATARNWRTITNVFELARKTE